MKKILSLIKASMTENMDLFRIKSKNQKPGSRRATAIFLFIFIFFIMWSYANMFMEQLSPVHLEFVGLTIFAILTTALTLVEGVYKSSSLLFNCKDDNLMFSLPIKKGVVLFIRVFKLYVFEVLYNSMFLMPAMVAYIRWAHPGWTYYLTSVIALLMLPMIPIAISCVIGMLISSISARFKKKNLVQIVLVTIFLLLVFYASYNLDGFIAKIVENANSINEVITRFYYPVGLYIDLVTNFNIPSLLIFIGISVGIFALIIFILSSVYFKINSRVKSVKVKTNKNKNYKIKSNKPLKALIKKEFKKFVSTPVFVINSGFGLALFIAACIMMSVSFESLINSRATLEEISIDSMIKFVPLILMSLLVFSTLLSSITSSMISLEGQSFNILKSLPVKPYTIIKAKILTAIIVMIPCLLIGDIIVIARYGCNIIEFLMIMAATIVLPLVSQTLGILINLKYPKMDATNDSEVVKQSFSASIAVFAGLGLTGITCGGIITSAIYGANIDLIMGITLAIYTLFYIALWLYLKKTSVKKFNEIIV
jgi:ABC-2 type transport system permease protein